jgi:poly-gamma-glutamate synthesis protein (capsule biosynthesis protein)
MNKAIHIPLAALAVGFLYFVFLHQDSYTLQYQKKHEYALPATPLLFVGDVMLGRYVETLAMRDKDDLRSFGRVRDFLSQHVTIANLEGPIPLAHAPTPINGFSFSFPTSTPRTLAEGGISAVSLANNHMFDKGNVGYEQTKRALDAAGISHFGGYAPTDDSVFVSPLGDRGAVIFGITMIATGWDEEGTLETAERVVREHPGAHVIAYVHWGDEYSTQNAYQREFAHKLIDRGVDTIVGAHPHVVQGIEIYAGKPIFYSLGNFIFDQYWHKDTEKGYMVRMSQAGARVAYELIPVMQSRSVVSLAEGDDKTGILADISRQSDASLQPIIMDGQIDLP